MKKILLGILLGIVLVTGTIAIAYYGFKVGAKKEINTNLASTIDDTMTKKIESNKIDAAKDLVYSGITNTVTLNKAGVKTVISNVPVINLNYENIKTINDRLKSYFDSIKSISSDGFNATELSYKYYINGNLLSLIVTTKKVSATALSIDDKCFVYNINTSNGQLVTNDEIMMLKGVSYKTTYNVIMTKIVENANDNHAGSDTLIKPSEETKSRIQMLISEVQLNVPMFLNDQGHINVIIDATAPIENGRFNQIYDLGI